MKKNIRINLLPKDREVADRGSFTLRWLQVKAGCGMTIVADCRTCIKRRIKCDRSGPSCEKCATRGLQCPGYPASQLRWAPLIVPGDSSTAAERRRRLRSTATTERDLILQHEETRWAKRFATATLLSRLLDHFINDTVRRLVWLDEHSNPWRTHIWPLSKQSPLLRLCLLTLSTAHIAAISRKDFDNQVYRASRDASVRALSANLGNNLMRNENESQESCTEALAAIVALCYGDLFIKHRPDQALHLHACRVAVDTGLLLQERIGTLNETLQFAVKEATELEANANMFSFHDTAVIRSPDFITDRKPFWLFTGFIHEVTAAERKIHLASRSSDVYSTTNLETWVSKLELARRSILAETCSNDCSSPACDGQLKGGPPLETVVHLNHLACLIYTYQSISPNTPDDLRLRIAISSLLDGLEQLTDDWEFFHHFAHDIYWPLFIAGTVSRSDSSSQAGVTHMFMRSINKTGHWCNYDALQFLKTFWEATDSESTSWLTFARKRLGTIPSFTVF